VRGGSGDRGEQEMYWSKGESPSEGRDAGLQTDTSNNLGDTERKS